MDTFFYVADDIQSLADGKTLMVGVYPDRVLLVNFPKGSNARPTLENPMAIGSLAMMVTVSGLLAGERTVQPVLTFPDGSPAPINLTPLTFRTELGRSANLLLKFTPFLIAQEGNYTLSMTIDDTLVESSLEVRFAEQDTPASLAGAQLAGVAVGMTPSNGYGSTRHV